MISYHTTKDLYNIKNSKVSTVKPQNRQKIIIRIIDKIKIYYSIDFVDYWILSITIICRIIDKK